MIFSSVGSIGSVEQFSPGTVTLDFSPASTIPVGALAVMWVAWDSRFGLTEGPCPMHERFAAYDDAGNIWTMVAAGTGTQCFFNCGAWAGIFVCHLKNAITSSDTITVEAEAGNANAMAASLWEFAVEPGWSWSAIDYRFGCREDNPGLPVMVTTYDTPQEYLWLYGLGSEGPNTDSFTIDAGYTAIDQDGTTAGAPADENMTIVGAWLIQDGVASETITNTNNTASRDTLSLFGAITPVRLPLEFPTTPILDDFNRADEDPLDNGTWNTTETSGPSSPGTRLLQLLSNEAAGGPSGAGGQFWLEEMDCNDVEVYSTYETIGSRSIDLVFHAGGSTDAVTAFGYSGNLTAKTNAGPDDFWHATLGLLGNQGGVDEPAIFLWIPPSLTPQDGWQLGCKRDGDWNHLYLDMGSGWEWMGAINTQETVFVEGDLGLAIWDGTSRADDFGGGKICPPQFYRRVGG